MTNTRESFRDHETGEGGSDRAFGFVFSAVFLLFGVFSASSAPLLRGGAVVAGIAFGAVALAAPARLAPLNRLWDLAPYPPSRQFFFSIDANF